MIQKLNHENLQGMLPISKGRNTLLRTQLLQLQPGEILFLPKTDWKSKNPPYYVAKHIMKTQPMRFEYGFKIDGTGWLFRRVA